MLDKWPTIARLGGLLLGLLLVCHKTVTYFVFYPSFRLLFGTLYPAYASYKAVRTKNVKEYVKWMMYWIVFALFTCVETFTDVFLSWFPFYYEIKIVIVIWLLSPATKGSSILYRKFVHPTLSSREQEIDDYINKAKEQSYRQVLDIGSKGVSALMQTAIKSVTQLPVALALLNQDQLGRAAAAPKDRPDGAAAAETTELSSDDESGGPGGPPIDEYLDELVPEESKARQKGRGRRRKDEAKPAQAQARKSGRKIKAAKSETDIKFQGGGGLVNQLRKSYSLGDLTDAGGLEEAGGGDAAPALARRRRSPLRSASTTAVYFAEGAVAAPLAPGDVSSSGYSSGEGLTRRGGGGGGQRAGSLTRSKSTRVTRSNVPRKPGAGDDPQSLHYTCIYIVKTPSFDSLFTTKSQGTDMRSKKKTTAILCSKDIDEHDSTIVFHSSSSEEAEFFDAATDADAQVLNATPPAPPRGGRYNKRRAPPPPPVRATLVLRPGRLRTLDAARKEVFLSPRAPRRRCLSRLDRVMHGASRSVDDLSRGAAGASPAALRRLIVVGNSEGAVAAIDD
ncbi:unnamed protein product [Phyllotreta striolata]|uniref:Receptor expression-enhancing protein n=1 Tax=Phyllotreta striolata TaxID=444603 RepID=A0A9N9TG05_PHYSR|nr:unnamed protein product [Phyllotreta striolata]